LIGESGLDLVKRLRDDGFDGVIIVITAFGTVSSAVEAVKLGADEYLQKPVSLEEISLLVGKSLANRKLRSKVKLYERLERVRGGDAQILGESESWKRTLALAQRFAQLPVPAPGVGGELPTILLLGETGAGKGALAPYLHRCDPRYNAADPSPFVHVNCAALPMSLIEGELFGHEKGSFTDAKASRAGLFEMAEGGTIFLDEIGEMPLEMQSKLLTVVEKGVFRRIGGSVERTARARIIAATNQDLEERVRQGTFRRDLLYRLNALTIRIPSLRERGDDAVLMAQAIVSRYADGDDARILTFSPDALSAIRAHTWPGNVRELINVVKRAAILCEQNMIRPSDLALGSAEGFDPAESPRSPDRAPTAVGGDEISFGANLPNFDQIERALIVEALKRAGGNVSLAAKLIGLNRGALRYRIERLGLDHHNILRGDE